MSSTLEDRLTAALAARADLIQHEDLRQSGPPAPPRLRPSIALLAAASLVIAGTVAAVWLTSGDGRPEPAGPMPDGYVEVDRVTGDVDGDGRADLVRIGAAQRADLAQSVLVVDPTNGGRQLADLGAGAKPELVGLTDIGLPGKAVVTRQPRSGSDTFQLAVYAIDGDAGLREIPEGKQNRSSMIMRTGWSAFATEPELTTWSSRDDNPALLQVLNVYRWAYESGKLIPSYDGLRCLRDGDSVPTDCPRVSSLPNGMSAGDSVSTDIDGDGFEDPVTLYRSFSSVGGVPVETAVMVFARTYESGNSGTYLPLSVSGRVDQVSLETDGGSSVEAVIVEDMLGSTLYHVYAWVDGQLHDLRISKQASLQPETTSGQGRRALTTARAPNGDLLTWEITDDGSQTSVRTVQVYRWELHDRVLVPVEIGEQCLDPGRGKLPRTC